MVRDYAVSVTVEYSVCDGRRVWWIATCHVTDGDQSIQSQVRECEQIATVTGRGRVDIGEPWPDPTTPVGLSRLLAIAEGLAVTEWERRFGGTSDNPR